MILPVILSGGAGTRLWPLSREAAPKPFMILPDGETLLGKTAVARAGAAGCHDAADGHQSRPLLLDARPLRRAGRSPWRRAPRSCSNPSAAIPPPQWRWPPCTPRRRVTRSRDADTRRRPPDPRPGGVRGSRCRGGGAGRADKLVTFGITPTHPETGFGYIECGAARCRELVFAAARFVEKPALARRRSTSRPAATSGIPGMFAFTPAAILAAFARHAPELLASARQCWQKLRPMSRRADCARNRRDALRGGARHLDRLRGHGEGGGGRRRRRRARRLRLERRRFVEGGGRTGRAGQGRQSRPGRARRHRDP